MKAQNPTLKMLVGLGLLVLIILLWKNSQSSIAPSRTESVPHQSLSAPEKTAAPTTTTLATSKKDESLNGVNAALKECGSALGLTKEATSPDDLIQKIEQNIGVKEKKKDLENYHLQMADGSERRVHLIYYDGNDSKKMEMRFFKVDSEGYPDPIRISKSLQWNPKPEAVQSFLKQGELVHHESKDQWLLQNGLKILMEIHDGKVFDLQIRGSRESLVCREDSCRCLH